VSNTYAYVGSNPLSYADPKGLRNVSPGDILGAGGGGGIVIPIAIGGSWSASQGNSRSDTQSGTGAGNATSTDQIRDPSRSRRGEAMCRCKAATNAEGGRGPTPQEWFYAERSGPTIADAARAACRQANKFIGIAYPGCQGEHCHCVCSDNGGPPMPYNPG